MIWAPARDGIAYFIVLQMGMWLTILRANEHLVAKAFVTTNFQLTGFISDMTVSHTAPPPG